MLQPGHLDNDMAVAAAARRSDRQHGTAEGAQDLRHRARTRWVWLHRAHRSRTTLRRTRVRLRALRLMSLTHSAVLALASSPRRLLRPAHPFPHTAASSAHSKLTCFHPVSDQIDQHSGNSPAILVQPVGTPARIVATSPSSAAPCPLIHPTPSKASWSFRGPTVGRLCHSRRTCDTFSTSPPAPVAS